MGEENVAADTLKNTKNVPDTVKVTTEAATRGVL